MRPDTEQGELSAFQQAGISCPGERPWLGDGANETGCREPLVGALINQTNLYFPCVISAIALPEVQPQDPEVQRVRNEISQDPDLGVARTLWNMGNRTGTIALVQANLASRGIRVEFGMAEEALESVFDAPASVTPADAAAPGTPESELLAFRRAEFNVIRRELNDPVNVPHLRSLPTPVPPELAAWISRVNLVERLRETRAFYGFSRLVPEHSLSGMPERAMSQLFRNPPSQPQDRWLPAVEVFGEGIYLELDEARLRAWIEGQGSWLAGRLDDAFVARLAGEYHTLPPLQAANRAWAARYLVVHTLAHLLIGQLVFECGYSTASLRERLFVSADAQAPMAGMLLYTSAGDSEGTLGGLVRLGRAERFGPLFRRALGRASWCSADPICSENLGGQGSRLANLAACHACALLPETSCETINHGLDRAMIVGTPDAREHGFLSALLEDAHVLS